MDADIEHITQITRQDLRDIAAATNPQPGTGVKIGRTKDGFKFSIDEQALRSMIWTFMKNGGASATSYDELQAISLTDVTASS